MDNQPFYRQLVQRYLEGTATQEELHVFFSLLEKGVLDVFLEEEGEKLITATSRGTEPRKQRYAFPMRTAFGIAALVVLLLFASYFILQTYNNQPQPTLTTSSPFPQALPGTKKAMLTLSNGKTVLLDTNAIILQDGTVSITKKGDALMYPVGAVGTETGFNTIVTPRGGEYQVVLPDGSRVWLNASSSLRYPTRFADSVRSVELEGEAYFEVARNERLPFVVHAAGADVHVLGTHFNVMAYADATYMKTTLTEGAVLLNKAGDEKRLRPGEGATIRRGASTIQVAPAHVDQDLAWMRGLFLFDKTPLVDIMKQIGRWYDLDIQYADGIPEKRFVGRISRHTNLSDVLAVLEWSGVRFSMKGKTLIVEN